MAWRPFHPHPAHGSRNVHCSGPVILHVTFGVYPRRNLLASPEVHAALVDAWRRNGAWAVGYYVIMPDHIHLFCTPGHPEGFSVRHWGGRWKRSAGLALPVLRRAFQQDCWDTRMRSADHFHRKTEYVQQNPVRWGVVADWRQWPYQGTINELLWLA